VSKVDQWMPLYIAEYTADTTRFTCEQHGAYLLLIMDYWRNGPPPDDDAVLAQVAKLTPVRWRAIRPVIQAKFQVGGGEWKHKRVEKEIAKAKATQQVLSERGKEGAAARWNKDDSGNGSGNGQSNGSGNATAMQQAMPKTMLADAPLPSSLQTSVPSSGPSPSPSPGPKTKARKRAAIRPTAVSEKVWDDFQEIRKAKRAPLTDTALTGIKREAGKAGITLQAALEMSCARGWQGFEAQWVNGSKPQGNADAAAEAKRRIFGERDVTDESERL
jgi:uncharacterized protein YdaU (DUF1376 family)